MTNITVDNLDQYYNNEVTPERRESVKAIERVIAHQKELFFTYPACLNNDAALIYSQAWADCLGHRRDTKDYHRLCCVQEKIREEIEAREREQAVQLFLDLVVIHPKHNINKCVCRDCCERRRIQKKVAADAALQIIYGNK